MPSPDRPLRAAVVGAGTMGAGLAQVLALGGVPCALADVSAARAAAGRERAIDQAVRHAEAGLLGDDAPDRVAAGVRACASMEAAAEGAHLVLEAVAEDREVKHDVLARVEAVTPGDAVLASNTSAIPIAALAEPLERPERFLGAHWFNPPQWVPCVELIPAPHTSPAVVEGMADLLRSLGKRPVTVGDAAGFVANRIQFAMFREAAAVVAEGIATAAEVDDVVRVSFGFRLPFFGPFAIADMAGLDVYAGAFDALEAAHGPHLAAPPTLRALVAAGRLGTKAGGGFLAGDAGDVAAAELRRDRAYAAMARLIEEVGAWE